MNSKIHEVVVKQIRGLLVAVAAFVKLPDCLSPCLPSMDIPCRNASFS